MNLIQYLWYQAVVEQKFPYILLQFIFIPLSLVYRLGLSIRHLSYRLGIAKSVKLPCRVISVGNITVGGTGKTPLVIYLAKMLAQSGKKVGILARGYGRIHRRGAENAENKQGNLIADDEALVSDIPNVVRIAQPDRVKAAQILIGQGVHTIILDDGFQHWRIKRSLDIVVIDSTNPFGNGLLLPAGILREPLSALKRADMFVLTHTDFATAEALSRLEDYLKKYQKPIIKTVHQPIELVSLDGSTTQLTDSARRDKLSDQCVYGFCGIGTPAHFRRTLQELFALAGFESFPDHYNYSADDIKTLARRAVEAGANLLVTTQKDAIRLTHRVTLRVRGIPDIKSIIPEIKALKIELKLVAGEDVVRGLVLSIGC